MIDIFQVDSFATELFKGNPAGVCILNDDLDDAVMQAVAMEMAVSETAFIILKNMNLRWFTPQIEVELCGHATLATAWVLFKKGVIKENQLVNFNTIAGVLSAYVNGGVVEMDFPLITVEEAVIIDRIRLESLGIKKSDVLFYGKAGEKEFIEVENAEVLKALKPDFERLSKAPGRGVIVTSKGNDACDFFSRSFAPWVGVNEDPVTGSAHCALAHYWSTKYNKLKMVGYQSSKRGGFVSVEVVDGNRVKISGNAVISIEGKMHIDAAYCTLCEGPGVK